MAIGFSSALPRARMEPTQRTKGMQMDGTGENEKYDDARGLPIHRSIVEEAAELIISQFPGSWPYNCLFRFGLAVAQRALMREIALCSPSLEIGINDGSSAAIAQFGKP